MCVGEIFATTEASAPPPSAEVMSFGVYGDIIGREGNFCFLRPLFSVLTAASEFVASQDFFRGQCLEGGGTRKPVLQVLLASATC